MSAETLNLFPARIPIGQVVLADGSRGEVLMSLEFSRALSDLFFRVGGAKGIDSESLALLTLQATAPAADDQARAGVSSLEMAVPVDQSARIAALQQRVDDLMALCSTLPALTADVAALQQRTGDVEQLAVHPSPLFVDWERPGKLGEKTANTVKATSLEVRPATQSAAIAALGSGTLANVVGADGASARFWVDAFAGATNFVGRRANTSGAAPSALANNDQITALLGAGYGATGYVSSSSAKVGITFNAAEAWTDAACGTYIDFRTTPKLSTVLGSPMRLQSTGALTLGTTTDDGVNRLQVTGSTKLTGSLQATTGFGCNGAAPQTAAASGGALAAYAAGANGFDTAAHASALYAMVVTIRAALVANGTMS